HLPAVVAASSRGDIVRSFCQRKRRDLDARVSDLTNAGAGPFERPLFIDFITDRLRKARIHFELATTMRESPRHGIARSTRRQNQMVLSKIFKVDLLMCPLRRSLP